MKRSRPRRPPGSHAVGDRCTGPPTRFVVDAMHGSLARKLRALGFDSSYYREGDDAGIIELATKGGRVILTSDRSLVSRASSRGLQAVLLAGRSDGSRIREISAGAARLGITLVRGGSLCSLCGGGLVALSRAEASGRVPQSVERRHRLFYRCASCGQLYWHGSHWKKLRSLARQLDAKRIAPST